VQISFNAKYLQERSQTSTYEQLALEFSGTALAGCDQAD
jgi:hypothetical protein